ncbi:hypothetical protein BpHYR1_002117 [Brachionus plicatilis]|uniref:Uncharacterized protein n=1 Tax=Brachionus plicatilis TaxID=10195 RepID=A0A3M7PJW5_BRAPC|nr:hypothetical protein BpHYR1_002117 [Brachionus plicatilis]
MIQKSKLKKNINLNKKQKERTKEKVPLFVSVCRARACIKSQDFSLYHERKSANGMGRFRLRGSAKISLQSFATKAVCICRMNFIFDCIPASIFPTSKNSLIIKLLVWYSSMLEISWIYKSRALIVQKHLSSGTQIFRHLSTLTVEDQADHFEHVVLVEHVLLNKTA